jgi:hypothetical protein
VSDKRGWGKTVLGWFVVPENDDGAQPSEAADPASGYTPAANPSLDQADALIAKYAGGPPVQAPPVELKGPLPPVVAGTVDFTAVFEAAGVDAAERDRVKKAQDLLRSLPAETPTQVKRQIVEASLRAFGVPTEQIIEAGVGEIEALESFIRTGQQETQTLLSDAAQKIAALEAEIASVREIMQSAVAEQEARTKAANKEKLTVQEVLEFFGREAVAKVVEQSSKLHTPT